ncbi:hypothetical protein H0A61_02009 [Koleobacter methoxysyntrophicus]|jgi:hypothetical protein|uniref:Uncharacterized protein n=1 Tax=Koleobacter methoxysyntrophicus TaxID=2751313 RepID=A0A8A0RP07_9FIRM|nr:hypothetical protein H0A61_02009 [Koleobacter methoxysyntrophicus]
MTNILKIKELDDPVIRLIVFSILLLFLIRERGDN